MNLPSGENEIEQFWKDYYHYYIKFCGVTDEFLIIKQRWTFLKEFTWSLKPNPYIINAAETLISTLGNLFSLLGFKRNKLENKKDFVLSANEIGLECTHLNLLLIKKLYVELSGLLGYLKEAFYQRIASLEAPSTISGLPESPERTLGNELILLAADNLTERYLECVRFAFPWKWDGVISFLYPQMGPFGGFTALIPSAKTFHISLTEDGKYFIGDFLTLAHEVGHAVIFPPPTTEFPPIVETPFWFQLICKRTYPIVLQKLYELKNLYFETECMNCPNFYRIRTQIKEGWADCLNECLADLIGLKIAGISSLHHLIDYVLDIETFLRLTFALGFDSNNDRLSNGVIEAERRLQQMFKRECSHKCVGLLLNFGKRLGERFARLNVELPESIDDYQKTLQLPSITSINSSYEPAPILSHFIQDEFQITPNDEETIKQYLLNFKSCASFDPRNIVHVYYKIYREEGNPPNFAVTLHSLAFNNFRGSKRQ